MRDFLEAAVGSVVAVLVLILNVAIIGGASPGVVQEHCADLDQARRGIAEVDSGWTYILWPPVFFSNVDPAGGCVRNSPLREGLAAVGVWELDSPEAQVREHIRKQLPG